MGAHSDIEWTDATWNPTRGCSRVSPGCQRCYAERLARRFTNPGGAYEGLLHKTGVWNGTVALARDHLLDPLHWVKPRRIFVDSMSDLFHEAIPFEYIDKVFAVMACTTRHTYQILTKRPQRMVEYFARLRWSVYGDEPEGRGWDEELRMQPNGIEYSGLPHQVNPLEVWPQWQPSHGHRAGYDNCGPIWPLENVHLGVSCEDQETANTRIFDLLACPAKVHFLSLEPLLAPIDLTKLSITNRRGEIYRFDCLDRQLGDNITWVIVGGESGPGARPMHPDWARSLRDQCQKAGVPFMFKQWGAWAPGECALKLPTRMERTAIWWGGEWRFGRQAPSEQAHRDDEPDLFFLGKGNSHRTLDGRIWEEFPQ